MGLKRDQQAAEKAAKRAALASALCDIVLADGLDALSLRSAATRLGTSDRMLLYYFGTKAALIADTLASVSQRLASSLTSVSPQRKSTPSEMIGIAINLLAGPDAKPFMALWAEIVSRAVRGDAIFQNVVDRTIGLWSEWIVARTEFPAGVDPAQSATAILAVVEGISMFGLLGANVRYMESALFDALILPRSFTS